MQKVLWHVFMDQSVYIYIYTHKLYINSILHTCMMYMNVYPP